MWEGVDQLRGTDSEAKQRLPSTILELLRTRLATTAFYFILVKNDASRPIDVESNHFRLTAYEFTGSYIMVCTLGLFR